MGRWNPRSPWLVGLLMVVVIALVATACSGGEDSADTTSAPMATTVAAFDSAGGGDGGGEVGEQAAAFRAEALTDSSDLANSLGNDGIDPIVFQTADLGRDIIFVADMTVAVTDVPAAGDAATREIAQLGGFLFGQRTTGAPNPVSVLTFKVLPEDFPEALDRLGEIGEVRAQNMSTSDVTERIVDLESRILSAEASVERLRELLSSAGAVAVVVQVETELLQRETQLETLRGQLRTLTDQVSLATIVVTLTEALDRPLVALEVTAYPGHDGLGQSCHGEAGLSVEEGAAATICFEIINRGDTPLTGFELNDPVLDLELDDLIVVFGETADTIEPGESIMLATEIETERDLRTQTRVTATPVNQEGQPLTGRTVAATSTIFINAVDPGGVPGFTDGLTASLGFLADLGRVIILSLGVALPFMWLIPILVWLLVRWRRRDRVILEEGPAPG
ncbi:MAG: DUF4349 domain-containing protein [Acidimicrobiia bacterium]